MPEPSSESPQMHSSPPVVVIIAGNDPSGGAGLAADIQTVSALGCHPAPVVTSLTVQDTRNAYRVEITDAGLVSEQARAVFADMPARAVKIGLLPDAAPARAVADVLADHRHLPIVLDPVLVASGGAALAEADLVEVLLERLVPLATIVTPNALEIRRLGGEADGREARARSLLARGCRWVLVKGADEDTPGVENALYGEGFSTSYRWGRLPEVYHGSGCTLASAIAAQLAAHRPVPAAVQDAQRYTYEALQKGYRPGQGQFVPRRMHTPNHEAES